MSHEAHTQGIENPRKPSKSKYVFSPQDFQTDLELERRVFWRDEQISTDEAHQRSEYFARKSVQFLNEVLQKVEQHECDVLVFLDRSARPLAYLLWKLWKNVQIPTPLPKIMFVNIGRESEDKDWEAGKNIFGTYLKGKKVVIVDERTDSGKTLQSAEDFIHQCEPTSVSTLVVFPKNGFMPNWASPVLLGVKDNEKRSVLVGRYDNKTMNGIKYHRADLKDFSKRVALATSASQQNFNLREVVRKIFIR